MKRVFIHIVLILIGFLVYFLQANFFSGFTIAGIQPNLFVIYILFIGLFGNKSMGIVYGCIYGVILDLLLREKIGAYLIGLAFVGIVAVLFNKNFSIIKNTK